MPKMNTKPMTEPAYHSALAPVRSVGDAECLVDHARMSEFVSACVKPERRIEPADGVLRLRERKADMEVEIVDLPKKMTAVHVERIGHLSAVPDGPRKRICDYLLIADCDGKSHAVFVEIKKSLAGSEKSKEQLRRSKPILEYLRCVCSIECGVLPEPPPVIVHYWIIAEKNSRRLDKQPIKIGRDKQIESELYMNIRIDIFVGARIRFADLISG